LQSIVLLYTITAKEAIKKLFLSVETALFFVNEKTRKFVVDLSKSLAFCPKRDYNEYNKLRENTI